MAYMSSAGTPRRLKSLLVLALVAGVSATVSIVPTTAPVEGAVAQPRDPWLRPFTSDSIWNMPIGSGARFVDANLPLTKRQKLEQRYFVRTSQSDPARELFRPGSWRDRCSGTKSSGFTVNLPDGWMPTQVGPTGPTPNNAGVFLQPDGRTLFNFGAMGRCSATGPLYAHWPSPEKFKTDLYGDGQFGAHGASKLSSLGGAIRPGDLTGTQPINHALDLLVWSQHLYWGGNKSSSFRWPATDSDSYAGPERYQGTNPDLRMGSLLALPPSVNPASLGISTEVGQRLFDALQNYGAYITDDSAWDATHIGVDAEAMGTFTWGEAERGDMAKMVAALHVVANNGPNSIGGGGTPRRPLLPELVDPQQTTPSTTTTTPDPVTTTSPAPADTPTTSVGGPEMLFSDSFDGSRVERLNVRTTDWTADGGVIVAGGGSAWPTYGGGSTTATVDVGTPDVRVKSTIRLSTGRSATGLLLRATDRNNAIVVSLVVRNGQNRVSLHAIENGRYSLLDQRSGAGLGPGQLHLLEATVDGRSASVSVDGRSMIEYEFTAAQQLRHGSNTKHGLRVMRNNTADDGGSRWLDVAIEHK